MVKFLFVFSGFPLPGANLVDVCCEPLSVDEPKKVEEALDGPTEPMVESAVDFWPAPVALR